MNETYYAGVYWPGRLEPVESYARRAEVFFRLLAHLDPVLTRWFEQANSRAAALKSQFKPEMTTLLKLFGKKKYQAGVGEIGFWAWNGESANGCEVNFSCGSSSPYVVDLCIFTPPPPNGYGVQGLLSASILTQALRAMALAWEPEWGIATSDAHRDEVLKLNKVGTFVGWVMYFSRSRGEIPPLPTPVHVEPVEDKGTLIVLTPDRFTASNPEHIALAAQVQEILDQAGLLKPLRPLP